ncbi:MAG: PIN domain nuclease [Elusimicrobia bacterium]|nr:PIN domain nuclease [Elusimicrobiota bacterium]
MAVLLGPVIGWFQVSRDAMGILVGVGAAIFIILTEIVMERVSLTSVLFGVIGAGLGLIFAWFINEGVLIVHDPRLSAMVKRYSALIYIVCTYLGMIIAVRRQQELEELDRGGLTKKGALRRGQDVKVLDTSAIIDGRIVDVCEAKFLTGTLVVPRFVLRELQEIADSSDTLKRVRGRRGLEVLRRLQENPEVPVKVLDRDYPDLKEVDAKLIQLAKELGAKVVTTDFNLNKVGAIQSVVTLNVNDLANALKPVVLPGEALTIVVAKEGKERDQGVGYLDDGTMVVVEDGRRVLGKKIEVVVSSVLQTSAGRMIFTRPKDREPTAPH